MQSHFPRFSIALVSACALSYEILLTRLFSIIQWHHFAYMIISLALLGYGVSGTFLTLFRARLIRHFAQAFIINIVLFGISTLMCFLIAQQVPFNAEEILWDRSQLLWLSLIYLVLMLPFFFVANAIGLALMARGESISRIYAADMTGAGLGSIAIIVLLYALLPNDILRFIAVAGLFAAFVAGQELRLQKPLFSWLLLLLCAVPLLLPGRWLELSVSPYKGLEQLLRIDGTHIVNTRSSPLGLIQVVRSDKVPLRHAPGLSINATSEPPDQIAVFTDGDNMSVINKHENHGQALKFLYQFTNAAPYHLTQAQRVLVIGAGTGADIFQARLYNVPAIDAVELNPQIIDLVTRDYAAYSGDPYALPGVTTHVVEARGFMSASRREYDVIQTSLLDAYGASSAGLYALNESYLYTVQALQESIRHLSSNGFLSITRWVKLPPRDSIKLFATAIEALQGLGVQQPGQQLLLLRGWQTSTLLIKKSPVTRLDIARLTQFCRERSFDMAYYPGIQADAVNQFNILRQPYFYDATMQLLSANKTQYINDYKFNITPATDNKPYFFNFFKWTLLPELLQLKGKGGMVLVEWGYMVMIATLVLAVIASAVLIVVPLFFMQRGADTSPRHNRLLFSLLYFFALGLAFLFVEIAFIQKFILFLHHPVFSVAVTLAAFLLFAGLGSAYSVTLQSRHGRRISLNAAVIGIVSLCLFYSVFSDAVFGMFLALPELLKFVLAIVFIAPLAFAMGMPFPLALSFLHQHQPGLVPWVWGVNGCASVLSAILASIIAVHFGFIVVILTAALLYLLAALVFPLIVRQSA